MGGTGLATKQGEAKKDAPTFNEIMNKAAKSAIRGGTAGAVAMGANVGALMWMRTTVRKKLMTWEVLPLDVNDLTSSIVIYAPLPCPMVSSTNVYLCFYVTFLSGL